MLTSLLLPHYISNITYIWYSPLIKHEIKGSVYEVGGFYIRNGHGFPIYIL